MSHPYFVDDFLLTSIGRNPVALAMTNSGFGWYVIPYVSHQFHKEFTEFIFKHLNVSRYEDFSEGEVANSRYQQSIQK